MSKCDYKFNEDKLIEEFREYVDSTYRGHYGTGGIQSSEVIVSRGNGLGFFLGNVDKYNDRYGKKGVGPDDWRRDLMKIIHYAFLALNEHDRIHDTFGSISLPDEQLNLDWSGGDGTLPDLYLIDNEELRI